MDYDAKHLYLRNLHLPLLTREEEVALARTIIDGEAATLGALAASPSGRAIFSALATEIENGTRRIDRVLRNPERGDDSERERIRTVAALGRAEAVALAELRLHPRFVSELEKRIRAADGDALDTRAIAAARRAVDRAKGALIAHNLGLVMTIAKRYRHSGEPFFDLIQNGNIGLLRAVDKFDHRAGNRLATYAIWWIRQSIERGIVEHGATIRIPTHLVEKAGRVRRAQRRLAGAARTNPTLAELAARTRLSVEKVAEVLDLPAASVSFDAPAMAGADLAIGDLIPSETFPPPDEALSTDEGRRQVHALLASLTDRERQVLTLRFGIDDDSARSLSQIGAKLSLTKERIRQIERAALEKLRQRSNAPGAAQNAAKSVGCWAFVPVNQRTKSIAETIPTATPAASTTTR